MPIQLTKNPYSGLNAHHLSLLQTVEGDWESFHAEHITHIREALREQLPPHFIARSEKSIQVIPFEPDLPSSRTRPDVMIFRANPQSNPSYPVATSTPIMSIALETLLPEPEDHPAGVVIYEVNPSNILGKPVCRIELLSPSNKPPQGSYHKYLLKREETLRSGIALVELDYLHQTPSILTALDEINLPASYPYYLLVSNPFPAEGTLDIFGFQVDEPCPIVPIPLGIQHAIAFDFGAVYNHSFERDDYAHLALDYAQLPLNFESYSPTDQARIRQKMATLT